MKWISVLDKKPKEGQMVFVIHNILYTSRPIVCCFYKGLFTFGPQDMHLPSTIALEVTHWIPLPEPPNE